MQHKNKICLITQSLGGGGLERVVAQQSIDLEALGYQVFMISLTDNISYNYKGVLLNLRGKGDDSVFSKINKHYQIHAFLRKHEIDIIIDHRTRTSVFTEFVFSYLTYFRKKTIYYVHNFKTDKYLPNNSFLIQHVFAKAHRLVAVSKGVAMQIKDKYGLTNVSVIYNYVTPLMKKNKDELDNLPSKYILYFGRLDDAHKNLKLLIDSYQLSILFQKNIQLLILGEGKDKNMLMDYVNNINMTEHIIFKPYLSNPYLVIKNALFSVLTSRYEGFGMVLLEALSCGVPVISVNCQSGPNEIIEHEVNGLLVENNKPIVFSEAMNRLVLDTKLYNTCKNNAKKSIDKFDKNVALNQLTKLFYNNIA